MSDNEFKDQWPDGSALSVKVVGHGKCDSPLVRFTTPEGHRIVTTLPDYNHHFPLLWSREESKWRNRHNSDKRERME